MDSWFAHWLGAREGERDGCEKVREVQSVQLVCGDEDGWMMDGYSGLMVGERVTSVLCM